MASSTKRPHGRLPHSKAPSFVSFGGRQRGVRQHSPLAQPQWKHPRDVSHADKQAGPVLIRQRCRHGVEASCHSRLELGEQQSRGQRRSTLELHARPTYSSTTSLYVTALHRFLPEGAEQRACRGRGKLHNVVSHQPTTVQPSVALAQLAGGNGGEKILMRDEGCDTTTYSRTATQRSCWVLSPTHARNGPTCRGRLAGPLPTTASCTSPVHSLAS